jgi:hypothetical protein
MKTRYYSSRNPGHVTVFNYIFLTAKLQDYKVEYDGDYERCFEKYFKGLVPYFKIPGFAGKLSVKSQT